MIAGHVGALPSAGQLQWRVRHRAWGSAARRRRAVVAPRATVEVTRLSSARPAATSLSLGKGGSDLALSSDGSEVEVQYLSQRAEAVTEHFETALGIDDFVQRLEIALWAKGFTNENTIAMVNLCRDEVTQTMKHKVDQIFGSSFNVNGLGGVLTCGATGMGAGLSHSPVDEEGRERYVFFSFPHIAIDAKGMVGHISRPGRSSVSCACGALIKSLGEIKKQGIQGCRGENGVHEPLDFEYSILKHRLAKRLEYEGFTDTEVEEMDLVKMTKVAERTITQDLELLISKAVDVNKADYAVVTGVQIHNWGADFEDEEPNLEFVAPTSVYVVVNGKKTYLNLKKVPGLTPRQIRLLATAPDAHSPAMLRPESAVCNSTGTSTLREIDPPYMYKTPEARRNTQERLDKMTGTAPALPAPEKPSMVLVHDEEASAPLEQESSLKLEFTPSPAPATPVETADTASATQKYYAEVYQAPATQEAPAPPQGTPLSADEAYYASVYQAPADAAAAPADAPAPGADEPAWSTHATINDSADQEYYTAQYYSSMYEDPAEPFAKQPRRWEAPRQNGAAQASSAQGATSSAVKPTLEVEFAIQCNAGFGNSVAVVGDVAELGAWDPQGALQLQWSEGDVWIGTVQLPPGVTSFKVVKLLQGGGVEWEDSENRSFSLPERFLQLDCSCKVHVSCHYNGKAADTLVEAGAEWVPMAANGNGNGNGVANWKQVDVAALNGTEPCLEPGNGAKDNGVIVALTDSSPAGKRQREDLLARFNALTNKSS